MQRELALGGAFLALLVLTGVFVVLAPGALAEPSSDDVRRDYVALREMSVAHGQVGGEAVELTVEARLQHDGGPSENVTVEFRAVSTDTGLVEASETVDVGTITGERETAAPVTLTVPREGGYRLVAVVYRDGERLSEGETTVSGVEALTPAYADTSVDFHRFGTGTDDLPPIQYAIQSTGSDTATLNVSTYLTNAGGDPSGDLRLEVRARQADSNIIAAERTVSVGGIGPGRTVRPATTLTVPAEYNYYLDAVLWKDGTIVASTRAAANLDPTETVSVNQTRREVGLQVEDFQPGRDGAEGDGPRPTETPGSGASGPGFGVPAALAALLLGILVLARRGDSHD
jgi:PGF-CTERM protein